MSFDVLFNQFMSGIARGALLFLVASGLSLIFGVLTLLNIAHGSIYMLGAFLTYSIWKHLLIPVVSTGTSPDMSALGPSDLGKKQQILYRVKRGDSLSRIARQHSDTVADRGEQ